MPKPLCKVHDVHESQTSSFHILKSQTPNPRGHVELGGKILVIYLCANGIDLFNYF